MKSFDHSSIGSRAATLFSVAPGFVIASFIGAAAVLAVAFCIIFFPTFLSFAAPFAPAGGAVFIAAGLLSAAHKTASQQQRRRPVPARIRRRD
jgi:hypothetical protein